MTGADCLFARRGPRALGAGLSTALLVLAAASGHATAEVPWTTETPCRHIRPAELELGLRADPTDPAVGDVVELVVQITNTTGGLAGIPLFRLLGAEPLFAIEGQESSYPFVEFVRYWLRAVQPGQATLQLSVNFETSVGCAGLPFFVFPSASSPPYPIAVRGDAATASPTPTPTATPLPPAPTARATARAPRPTPARTSAASPRR